MYYSQATNTGIVATTSDSKNLILPVNSNFFTIDNNAIVLNENGYYEFVFYGLLKDSTNTNKANLILKLDNIDLITINLSSETNELYFSQTTVSKCSSLQRITVEFNKNNNSSASAENIYLLIKKLYF